MNAKVRFTPETVTYGSNSFCRVKSVTYYGENNSTSYSDKIDFTYNGYTTVVANNHNDSVTVEFDVLGREVSYSSKGNTSKLMYNNSGTINNTVSSKSNSFASKPNLIYRVNQKVSSWSGTGSGYTKTSSTDRVNHYSNSMKVVGNNANAEFSPSGTNTVVRVSSGQTYTASVDVNIDGTASNGSFYLRVTSGSETVQSPAISTTGDGWMPICASITVPSGVTGITLSLVFEGFTGTAYADIAQVTEGDSASLYNMVPDSDFAESSRYSSSAWTVNGTVDSSSHQVSVNGTIVSNSAATQTFALRGTGGEELTFGFSGKSVPVPMMSGYFFGAKVVFLSGNSVVCANTLPLDYNSSEWQSVITSVSSTGNFDSVRIEFRNDMMLKNAVFKDVFLYKGTSFGYNYSYNSNKFVTGVADGAGNSKSLTYSGPDVTNILQISNTDTLENVDYTYDSNHNILTAEDNITGITTSYTYPASGNKGLPVSSAVTSSDNLTATTVYGYTSDYNYLTSITDSSGAVTQYAYNTTKGLVTKVTDANGNEINYSYNSNDLLSSIYADVGNDVAQLSYQYDSLMRLTSISNTDISYGFTYDLFGRSDTITSGSNTLADFTYNSDSTVSRVDNIGSRYGEFTYDDRDRVTSASYDGVLAYTYKYNDDNAVTEVYDAENDNTTFYLYDPLGRTVGITDTNGKNCAFAYDSQSRPVKSVIAEDNTVLNEQTYAYDSQSRVSGTSFGTINRNVSYSYDGLNRLTSSTGTIGTNKTATSTYTYKTNGNNATTRVDSISYTKTINGITTELYPTQSYDYDALGNITKIYEDGIETVRYHYDELNRLAREDNTYGNETLIYEYDACGDILNVRRYFYTTADTPTGWYQNYPYVYINPDWPNAQTSYEGLITRYNTDGTPYIYGSNFTSFNSKKQLESVGGSLFYRYDSNGMLIERYSYGESTEYFYSGSQLIKQKAGPVVSEFFYDASGKLYAMKHDGTLYYYIINLLGDVLGLYDESGNVVVKYIYDTWGNLLDTTGSLADSVGYFNPFRYRGYFYDEETWYYWLQSRFYDPYTRRFLSPDAYLVSGDHINSTNMYAYCLNNPVMYIDPTGRAAEHYVYHDVPAYSQGGDRLCWAVCQIMVMDYYNHAEYDNDINRARDLSFEVTGEYTDTGAIPLNIIPIPIFAFLLKPEITYTLLQIGPLYGRYVGDSKHMVVVTGIDVENDKVFTINPALGEKGTQSFSSFKNGVFGSSMDYRLSLVYVSTKQENILVKLIATAWFKALYSRF